MIKTKNKICIKCNFLFLLFSKYTSALVKTIIPNDISNRRVPKLKGKKDVKFVQKPKKIKKERNNLKKNLIAI